MIQNSLRVILTPQALSIASNGNSSGVHLDPSYESKRKAWRQAWQKDYDALIHKPNRTQQEENDLKTLLSYDEQDQTTWNEYLTRCSLYSSNWGNDFPRQFPDIFKDPTIPNSSPSSPAPKITPPDKVSPSGDTATYNTARDVNLKADMTSPIQTHVITVPGVVTLSPSSYQDEAVIQKNPQTGEITITIYKNGDRTNKANQRFFVVKTPPNPKEILIDCLPHQIKWVDPVKGGEVPLPISDILNDNPAHPDCPKLNHIFTYRSKNPPQAGEGASSKPDRTEGNTALYANSSNVEIEVGKGSASNHQIYASGNVIIRQSNFSDKVEIVPNLFGKYTITVYRNGDVNQKEVFEVYGPPSRIELDFELSQVKYKGRPYEIGVDSNVALFNEEEIKKQREQMAQQQAADRRKSFAQKLGVQDLEEGFEASLMAEFNELFPDSPKTLEEFNAWFANSDNWLKRPPEKNLIDLITRLNPKFDFAAEDIPEGKAGAEELTKRQEGIASLLKGLYPDVNIQVSQREWYRKVTNNFVAYLGIKFGDKTYYLAQYYHQEPSDYRIPTAGENNGSLLWKPEPNWEKNQEIDGNYPRWWDYVTQQWTRVVSPGIYK